MDLRERLKKFHEIEGVSYKVVAQALGISISVMYNYTSGIREIKPHLQEKLDQYLTDRNY